MSAYSAVPLSCIRTISVLGSADEVAAQAGPPAHGLWQGGGGAAGRARMYFCSAVSSSDASLSQPSAAPSARNCAAAASPQPRRRSCTGAAAAASCAAGAFGCAPPATCKHVHCCFNSRIKQYQTTWVCFLARKLEQAQTRVCPARNLPVAVGDKPSCVCARALLCLRQAQCVRTGHQPDQLSTEPTQGTLWAPACTEKGLPPTGAPCSASVRR